VGRQALVDLAEDPRSSRRTSRSKSRSTTCTCSSSSSRAVAERDSMSATPASVAAIVASTAAAIAPHGPRRV
jgi:hypothetical protein